MKLAWKKNLQSPLLRELCPKAAAARIQLFNYGILLTCLGFLGFFVIAIGVGQYFKAAAPVWPLYNFGVRSEDLGFLLLFPLEILGICGWVALYYITAPLMGQKFIVTEEVERTRLAHEHSKEAQGELVPLLSYHSDGDGNILFVIDIEGPRAVRYPSDKILWGASENTPRAARFPTAIYTVQPTSYDPSREPSNIPSPASLNLGGTIEVLDPNTHQS